jgi:hypothetical protein
LSHRRNIERALVWILLMNTRRQLGLQAQTLGAALRRGAQADSRGATQVLDRGGQVVARGNCLSLVLGRGAEAVARGAILCSSQFFLSCCQGRCPQHRW